MKGGFFCTAALVVRFAALTEYMGCYIHGQIYHIACLIKSGGLGRIMSEVRRFALSGNVREHGSLCRGCRA
jgi:hypothetical protein